MNRKVLLNNIFNESGEIDYGELKRTADAIEEGRATLDRLLVAAERGRKDGGRRNVEASLILGADERADRQTSQECLDSKSLKEKRIRQEQLIEAYARKKGIWFDYKVETKEKYLDKGRESVVYKGETPGTVKKIVYPYSDAATLLEFLDNKISLNNYLFNKTPYRVCGFTRSKTGAFMVVVEQPYISHSDQTISDPQILDKYKDFLRKSGWSFDEDNIFTIWNDDYIVHDLHANNILVSKDGNFYFIDTSPKLNTHKYGGTRKYGDYSVIETDL
jgi:hypothetical protein